MVKNFRFVEGNAIALSGVPETPEAADWLAEQGIKTVVSLHPVEPEVAARLRERGIRHVPVLIRDFTEPLPEGLAEALGAVARAASEEPAALIH